MYYFLFLCGINKCCCWARSFAWLDMWQASCISLGSAMSVIVNVIYSKWIELVNCKLSEDTCGRLVSWIIADQFTFYISLPSWKFTMFIHLSGKISPLHSLLNFGKKRSWQCFTKRQGKKTYLKRNRVQDMEVEVFHWFS